MLKNGKIAQKILQEIKSLRREVSILLPTEDLADYDNSAGIIRSYRKSIKQYETK